MDQDNQIVKACRICQHHFPKQGPFLIPVPPGANQKSPIISGNPMATIEYATFCMCTNPQSIHFSLMIHTNGSCQEFEGVSNETEKTNSILGVNNGTGQI